MKRAFTGALSLPTRKQAELLTRRKDIVRGARTEISSSVEDGYLQDQEAQMR